MRGVEGAGIRRLRSQDDFKKLVAELEAKVGLKAKPTD